MAGHIQTLLQQHQNLVRAAFSKWQEVEAKAAQIAQVDVWREELAQLVAELRAAIAAAVEKGTELSHEVQSLDDDHTSQS